MSYLQLFDSKMPSFLWSSHFMANSSLKSAAPKTDQRLLLQDRLTKNIFLNLGNNQIYRKIFLIKCSDPGSPPDHDDRSKSNHTTMIHGHAGRTTMYHGRTIMVYGRMTMK